MLPEDCRRLLEYVQQRDPVVVVERSADSKDILEVPNPSLRGGSYCLWNQALLPALEREFIDRESHLSYFRIDDELPVIELNYPNPVQERWNGRSALAQGRIYTGLNAKKGEVFEKWYGAIVRWIQKNFIRNPIPHLGGHVGPVAFEWYRNGGILLPMLRPPVTQQWIAWMEAQDQHRKIFS
jgi:hypothetical protein